jgi:hydroxypyruvate isomerase
MPSLIRYRASLDFLCDRAGEAGLDALTGLREMMPVIGHTQIASVPLRNEPGTGELDDFRVLRELESLGYTGFVGCEYRPAGNAVEGLGWLKRFESGSSQD